MKKFTLTPLTITRLLGVVFLWMNLGYAPDLHAQTRKSALDFTLDPANTRPRSLGSDGTTMWVASYLKIYAYNLATKNRDASKDFTLATENPEPRGIWSNGTTMWVANKNTSTLYAYNLATKAREADKDFPLDAANNNPDGIWSDGTTMWAGASRRLFAYNLATKDRDKDKGLNTTENRDSQGLWSDGTTMWVADWEDESVNKLYAYNLATKARDAGKDFNTLNAAENDAPTGIWSNDTTMWVTDFDDGKLYAYTLPKKDQTITFTFSTGIVGDTLDLSATASSGLEVTYSSSDPSIAEVGTGMEEGKLILKAAGNATITASQAGNDRYLVATDVSHTITVSEKLQQTITFTLSGTGMLGDTLDLSATASSTLEVTYSSSDPDIAEVGMGMNAGKLILKALGNVTITASQAGDTQYATATDVSHTITVNKKDQTITFTLSSTGAVGDTLDLSATASSGLEVNYVSSDPSIAEVGTRTNAGKLILKALGNATITASQAGDTQYATATDVTHTITVSKKPQTITFTFSEGVLGDTLDLSAIATASSMLEVTYVSSSSDIAEVGTGMNAGKLILKALGNATITASQAGNDRYLAATDVSHTITVSINLQQTITFTLSTGMLGDTLNLSDIATASSMLEVTYSSSNSDIAEVGTGMNAGKLILKTLGNVTITASQAGNDRYLAAPDVTHTITVNKKDQTITFTLSSTGAVGDTLDLSATASSGLEVTYSSSDPSIAEVGTGMNANKLILKAKALDSVTITAIQAGDDRYLAAPDVTQGIIVNKKDQTITFTLSSTGAVGDTLDLSATASSGLEVTYSSSDPSIAEVGTGMNANKLILKAKALDSVTITAIQAGNAQYAVATEVTQDIIVSEKVLSVDVKNTDIRVWPNPVATQLNISSGSRGKLTIILRNLTGQRLQERELEGEGQMDLALVPAGVYLLHIRTAKETISSLIYKE